MSCQQIREVMSLPPDPPHVNNNNYICLKYCPKGLDHLNFDIISRLSSNERKVLMKIFKTNNYVV